MVSYRRMMLACVVVATASSATAFLPCSSITSSLSLRTVERARGSLRSSDYVLAGGARLRAQAQRRGQGTCMASLNMAEDFKALVDAAEPGATIVLQEGTYVISGIMRIDKDLTVEAAAGAEHKVIITEPEDAGKEGFFLEVQSCGLVFDGVTVQKADGIVKNAGCVCVLEDGRVTFFNQPPFKLIFD